ncbi:MAG TPA: PAS domain-containing protein [Anaerolineae bacterium]|nr:PAS domain-containing protein [Anaerolineae bacterium]
MVDADFLAAILDSLKDPVLVADPQHVTRYMNRAAIAYYKEGESLLGRSLLDCHHADSQRMMVDILAAMQSDDGLDEQLITDNEKHRIYMRAVRDRAGQVIGYYERYAAPAR